MFPGWQLVTFSAERAVFHITIDGYCPDHYIVKHEDGMVVIYRPDMDTGIPLVVEATDIPYDRLSPEVKQELQEGIVVYGIEGVENLLENWGS